VIGCQAGAIDRVDSNVARLGGACRERGSSGCRIRDVVTQDEAVTAPEYRVGHSVELLAASQYKSASEVDRQGRACPLPGRRGSCHDRP